MLFSSPTSKSEKNKQDIKKLLTKSEVILDCMDWKFLLVKNAKTNAALLQPKNKTTTLPK